MDLLDQWQSPGDVRYAIIGPEGDGGRSGLVVSSADVQVHGPRGASIATVPYAGLPRVYVVPSDDARYFAIVTQDPHGVKSASTTLVRVYGPTGNQVATHSWRVEYDDSNPPFEVSGFDGTLAVTPVYSRDPHLLLPNGARVDFAPTEWIRDVDFVRDAPLVVTQHLSSNLSSVTTMMDMRGATLWQDIEPIDSPTFVRSSPDGSRVLVGAARGMGSNRFTTIVRLLGSDGEFYRRERTGGWNVERVTHEYDARAVAWSDGGAMVAVAYTDSVSVLTAATGATAYDAPIPTDGLGPRMCVVRVAVNDRGVCAVLAGKYERIPGIGSVDDVVEPELLLYDERGQLLDRRRFVTPRRGRRNMGAAVQSRREPTGTRRHDVRLAVGEASLTVRIAADEYRLSLD
jgi:hypothetical protein